MAFGLGFLGKMFGSEKAMSSAVDGIKKGLDALVYTDEERAEAAAIDRAAGRQMFLGWMDKTQGQNVTRRFLALMIAGTWLIQYIFVMVASVAAIWSEDPARLHQATDVVSELADGMTGAMMLILGFYFAAPHLGKMVDGAMARFGKSFEK